MTKNLLKRKKITLKQMDFIIFSSLVCFFSFFKDLDENIFLIQFLKELLQ